MTFLAKTLTGLAVVCTTLLMYPAHAQSDQVRWPNWYVGLNGGVSWYPNSDVAFVGVASGELKSSTGWMGSIALGYLPRTTMPVLSAMRLELEYAYRVNDLDSVEGTVLFGETHSNAFMTNMYFDFVNQTRLTPYVGGGVGMARVEIESSGSTFDDDLFAWQLMAGLSYEPASMPMTVWNIGYRYFATSDAEYDTGALTVSQEYQTHGLEAGAKFRF